MKLVPAILACVLLAPAVSETSWIDNVFEHLRSGRENAGVAAVERRESLDSVAQEYARVVADRPHSERLVQQRPISQYLDEADIGPYHQVKLHLDMGRGYTDYGEKFSRSWTKYRPGWKSAMDARFDSVGIGTASGDDEWVVFVAILVDDLKIPTDLRALETRTLQGVNEIRVERGLQPLEYHEGLAVLARFYSGEMARFNFFSHTGADGSKLADRAEDSGLNYQSIGENLHSSRGYDDPVPVALDGWMNSRGHRKTMLNDTYTHTGVGVVIADDGRAIFTQLFMLPKSGG
jgi:uncharacterized protein YkwD